MNLPAQDELNRAAAEFDRDWGGVDEVLYDLCRAHPGHGDRRQATAKIALIDRAYSAGLERQVVPEIGEQAVSKIATFMVDHGPEIDALVAALSPLREPLDSDVMSEVVGVHGRFAELLRGIPTRGTVPRSFAAKYLHFHCPIVPIYESYAANRLIKLVRWDSRKVPFARPKQGDADYWDFCVRFLRLYDACSQAGLSFTVKTLDGWLWQVPTAE